MDVDGCMMALFGILILLIVAMVFVIGNSAAGIDEGKYTEAVISIDYIAALSNNSQISGTFFLGSGVIDETPYYVYMRRAADGGLTMHRADVRICTVYETTEVPRIEEVCRKSRVWPYIKKNHINIYIPEGSIWFGYEVDVRSN